MDKTETVKHTPGPWSVSQGQNVSRIWGRGQYASDYSVAQCHCLDDSQPDDETHQANARLIAAAPELLEALKGVLDIMAYYHKAALPENANHADVCDMPDNCGHCKAILAARAAMDRVIGNDPNARVPKPNRDTCVGCPAETLHCHETCSTAIVERERIRAAIAKATKETP